jgi:polyphosphate glucokinase
MENTQGEILAIDIGGSHIKMTLLDSQGKLKMDYEKLPTPRPATPGNVMNVIKGLEKNFPGYEKISVGFPGYVKDGTVMSAPNLGTKDWYNVNFSKLLADGLGKPAKVINDADMQGLGVVSGKGLEMMITLGTGFGTALLQDGKLLPHLELSHHPVTKNKIYDEYVGEKALEQIGKKRWNKRIRYVLGILKTVFNYDTLYLGGGNAQKLDFKPGENIKIVSNEDGIHGGARLWE